MALGAVPEIQRLPMMRNELFSAKVVADFSVDSDMIRRRETGFGVAIQITARQTKSPRTRRRNYNTIGFSGPHLA